MRLFTTKFTCYERQSSSRTKSAKNSMEMGTDTGEVKDRSSLPPLLSQARKMLGRKTSSITETNVISLSLMALLGHSSLGRLWAGTSMSIHNSSLCQGFPMLLPVFCSPAFPGLGERQQDLQVRAERQSSGAPGMCKHTVCPAGTAHAEHFEPAIQDQL